VSDSEAVSAFGVNLGKSCAKNSLSKSAPSSPAICWLAALLCCESLDCGVPPRAPHAAFFEQFIRDTPNLESVMLAIGVAARPYLISQAAHLTDQRIPANLDQARTPLIELGCLERLPSALDSVIGQVGCKGMCVELRLEFTACVVAVCGHSPVGGRAIFIGTVEPDTCCRVTLGFRERFPDRPIVCATRRSSPPASGGTETDFGAENVRSHNDRPLLCSLPSSPVRSALCKGRRNSPVSGCSPSRTASNCFWATSPRRPSSSAPRPCHSP